MKLSTEKRISSREIAAIVGKSHAALLKSIRKQEVAWFEVNEVKFDLVNYTDGKGERRPEYLLNKKELLYISTKFNDIARVKLINRWEQLENERQAEEKNPDLIIQRYTETYKKRGMSEEWIAKRIQSLASRNIFTSTLNSHGVVNIGYRNCTNAMYVALYGVPATEIRKRKGLQEKANLRDSMTPLELSAISFAEMLATDDIKKNRRFGNEECALSSNIAGRHVSNSILAFRQSTNQND